MNNTPSTSKTSKVSKIKYDLIYEKPILHILSTRFNNITWEQNVSFREKNHFSNGCIYNSPMPLTQKIPLDALTFIIEMNNSINQIMGIGLIRNRPIDRHYNIYECENYHRYQYSSHFHIHREQIPNDIVEHFDKVLFKGKTHSKRGGGITKIPYRLLQSPKEYEKYIEEQNMQKQMEGVQDKHLSFMEKRKRRQNPQRIELEIQNYEFILQLKQIFIQYFPKLVSYQEFQ